MASIPDTYKEAFEVEHHFHGGARWFGATAAPPGGGVGPGLISSLNPFRVTANALAMTFGNAIVVLDGTEDFQKADYVALYDPHQIFITNVQATGTYKIRFANSQWNGTVHAYANMAEAVVANKYTEIVIKTDNTNSEATPLDCMSGRIRYGSILWAQVMKATAGADYVDFLVGCHTYTM